MICEGKMEGDPEACEEKVFETLPNLNCTDLVNLSLELGLVASDEIKANRRKLHKFVVKYLLDLEATEVDNAKAKYVQVYGYSVT